MKKLFIILFLSVFGVVHAQQLSPRQLYPGLFEQIQSSKIFPDNKVFVDAIPNSTPKHIIKNYELLKGKPGFSLKQFVIENFTLPGGDNKGFQSNIAQGVRKHIDTLWDVLQRSPDTIKNTSLVPLPYPYIVPGGRFREVYYWDSYFTMLGLQQSHKFNVIRNMISNFAYLIDTYGFIPNGNRTYYLTRSQPPFFCMMVSLLANWDGTGVYKKYQPELLKEYAYWMKGAQDIAPGQARLMVVKLPDGQLLNRYWDTSDQPREESYIEDVMAAKTTVQNPEDFYRNMRSAAASGWDFSSRWFGIDKKLKSIQTTDLVPVDLNCLLYQLELTIARSYKITGNIGQYQLFVAKAARRKAAIQKYCWDANTGWFYDYNWRLHKKSSIKTLAATSTLEFSIATINQEQQMIKCIRANFLKPGGLVTTANYTGQQWDGPNGWAPLQYITIDGLSKYHQNILAKIIATRWIKLNIKVFKQTGKLLEKYNVEDIDLKAGGGEYPLQDGFGWTNGVLLTLINRYNIQ